MPLGGPCAVQPASAVCGVWAIAQGRGDSGRTERRPAGRCASLDGAQSGKNKGVHNVHAVGSDSVVFCLGTSVTVLHQDIGDTVKVRWGHFCRLMGG